MLKSEDVAQAVGYVRIIKHAPDGSLIYDQTFKNQLTNYARNASAQMWTGTVLATPSKIQLGNGVPTPPLTGVDPTDTNLWNPDPTTLKQVDYAIVWLTYNSQYSVTYQQSEANGNWTEVGLKDANGNLWSHVALNNFLKTTGEVVTVQWQIQHVAS